MNILKNSNKTTILRLLVDLDKEQLSSLYQQLGLFLKQKNINQISLSETEKQQAIEVLKKNFFKNFGSLPTNIDKFYNYLESLFSKQGFCKINYDELFILCQKMDLFEISEDKKTLEYNQNYILNLFQKLPEAIKQCVITHYIDKNQKPPTTIDRLIHFLKEHFTPTNMYTSKNFKNAIFNSSLFNVKNDNNTLTYNF